MRSSLLLFSVVVGSLVYALFCAFASLMLGGINSEFIWTMLGAMLAGKFVIYPFVLLATFAIMWFKRQGLGTEFLSSDGAFPLKAQQYNERGEPLNMGTSPTGRYPGQSDPWRDSTGMSGSSFDNNGFS